MASRYQIFLQIETPIEDAAALLRRRFAVPIVQQTVGDVVQFTFTCLGVDAHLSETKLIPQFAETAFAQFPLMLTVSPDGEPSKPFATRGSFKEVVLFLAGLIDGELGWPCMVVYNDTLILGDSSQ